MKLTYHLGCSSNVLGAAAQNAEKCQRQHSITGCWLIKCCYPSPHNDLPPNTRPQTHIARKLTAKATHQQAVQQRHVQLYMQSNTHEQQHTHLTQKSSTAASSALQHIVYTQHNAACTLHWTGKATGAAPRHEIGTKTTTALHYGKDQKYQKGKQCCSAGYEI
jgi:hypothetical protein